MTSFSGGELFTDYSDHPRKLVTLNPNQPTGAGRYQLLPAGGCLPQAAWPERPSPKSQDAVALQQIKERVALYLWLIVAISGQQSTVAAISGLHCRALVMVVPSIRLTAWLQNSKKRAERSERLMYRAESHCDTCSGYLHHRLPAGGLLIINAITLLPTKPSATNARELKLANAAITDMQMRQRDVAEAQMQNTRRS